MSLDDSYPDHLIPIEDALTHVLENNWDIVSEEVHAQAAKDWLESEQQVLDLLNIVSGHDRDQLRESVRWLADADPARPSEADLAPSKLFTLASDVSNLLEISSSPYAGHYSIDDDLAWAVDLAEVTRTFREVLYALADPEPGWPAKLAFAEPLAKLNRSLAQGVTYQILVASDRKVTRFERKIDPATALHAVVANWIGQYLATYRDAITLAPCIECGRIFARERRDNIYCSKTCQNRVAYKRKRIFEAGVLQPAEVEASIDSLRAGLCLQHPRFGLGVIEDVKFPHRRIKLKFEGSPEPRLLSVPVPEGRTAQMVFEEVRTGMANPPAGWDEIVSPTSLTARVRFLSTVRTFSYTDLFNSRKDSPKFYAVSDPRRLAELL